MRAYRTHDFSRRALKAGVTDKELKEAAEEIIAGRFDADLGAHLVKQRVSQGHGGRSGSHRAIVATMEGDRVVFLHLFAKRDKGNLSPGELKAYRKAAKIVAALPEEAVEDLIKAKEWIEIEDYQEPEGVPE